MLNLIQGEKKKTKLISSERQKIKEVNKFQSHLFLIKNLKRGITSTGRMLTLKRGITSTLCWELFQIS
jgi:hypothetical protein